MVCPCDNAECITNWDEWVKALGAEEDVMHCESENCHNVYWSEKSGGNCVICGMSVCEFCISYSGTFDYEDDQWICSDCEEQDAQEKRNILRRKLTIQRMNHQEHVKQ